MIPHVNNTSMATRNAHRTVTDGYIARQRVYNFVANPSQLYSASPLASVLMYRYDLHVLAASTESKIGYSCKLPPSFLASKERVCVHQLPTVVPHHLPSTHLGGAKEPLREEEVGSLHLHINGAILPFVYP